MLNIKKVKYKVAAVKIQSYTKTQLHDEKALDWAANNSKNLKIYVIYTTFIKTWDKLYAVLKALYME